MKRIAVLTATRAEYGLLSPIIKKMQMRPDLEVNVVVTGAHLSPEFGMTYREIEQDGIEIDEKIEILLSADSPAAISKNMGLALISFGEYFERRKPDALLVLGDRYETLAVCCAAMNARIPIFHIHGGEVTEGAVDEAIRHSITKMSCLHFTSTEAYRKRVIQLGEAPDCVFNVGAVGVENVLRTPKLKKEELEEQLSVSLDGKFAVLTFHPVTLEQGTAEEQVNELLAAIREFPEILFIITKANADADGRVINRIFEEAARHEGNIILVDSLGMKRYLSALNYAEFVIGNSSSGIIEAPSFHIPTVNIGRRQDGRIKADSVIDCAPEKAGIIAAIEKALSREFRDVECQMDNPYGKGDTSQEIVRIIGEKLCDNEIEIQKKFHDVDFEI